MEYKYTPGPWELYNKKHVILARTNKGVKEAQLWRHQYENINELKANARLITAAPDLLEALQRLVESLEKNLLHLHVSDSYLNAKAAIKKAI